MARRALPEISVGSMADIAFLLLIFFLVTTTMDRDTGLMRLLPPVVDDPEAIIIHDRNIYLVLVNDADMLLVEDEFMDISDLREGAKNFLTNPTADPDLPERNPVSRAQCLQKVADNKGYLASSTLASDVQRFEKEVKKWEGKLAAIELIGEYDELPPTAVISLQTGTGTSYGMYISVQDELEGAMSELRNELSKEKFGVSYDDLSKSNLDERAMIEAIRKVYPSRISEAEPIDVRR